MKLRTVHLLVLGALIATPVLADPRYGYDGVDPRFAFDRHFANDSPWQLAAVLEDKADLLERLSDRQHAFVHDYGNGHRSHTGYESHGLENLFDQFERETDRLRSSLNHRGYVSRDAHYRLGQVASVARIIDDQLRHLRVAPEIDHHWRACREILFRLDRQL
ncbi:MAG TPA: hypothetical protein VGB99_12270 [Acidobacteriota bacterium]